MNAPVCHGLVCCFQSMAFTLKERQIMGLHGLLPPAVFTQEQQEVRVLANLRRWDKDIDKYIYLMGLLDRNERLFYSVSSAALLIPSSEVLSRHETVSLILADGLSQH